MNLRTRKYVIFGILGAVSLILDQWTKVLARHALKPIGHASKVIIDGFWKMRYSENTGVAFGMFQDLPKPWGQIILTAVALVAFVLVLHYLRKTDDAHTRMHAALGLVGGGAIGNLIDRILYGKVTDFIVWHIKDHEWPAFNVADAALVVGVALMGLDMLLAKRQAATAD